WQEGKAAGAPAASRIPARRRHGWHRRAPPSRQARLHIPPDRGLSAIPPWLPAYSARQGFTSPEGFATCPACTASGRGGIGRRAALRSLWGKTRGSSTLLDRTILNIARRLFACVGSLTGFAIAERQFTRCLPSLPHPVEDQHTGRFGSRHAFRAGWLMRHRNPSDQHRQ